MRSVERRLTIVLESVRVEDGQTHAANRQRRRRSCCGGCCRSCCRSRHRANECRRGCECGRGLRHGRWCRCGCRCGCRCSSGCSSGCESRCLGSGYRCRCPGECLCLGGGRGCRCRFGSWCGCWCGCWCGSRHRSDSRRSGRLLCRLRHTRLGHILRWFNCGAWSAEELGCEECCCRRRTGCGPRRLRTGSRCSDGSVRSNWLRRHDRC